MKATVKIDLDRKIGAINRNIYGQFLSRRPGVSEGGLYDPESPNADEYGLRSDVVKAAADLCPPIIRWPGGCTGTSYHWLDGVGPVDQRPRKIDLHFGWEARYEFGTDEFIAFCRRIGAEPHLNFAMGTADLEEAAGWVEYCNSTKNTYYANLRRKYGHEEPFGVKYWQLGNEMFGPWEIGYCKSGEYGVQAREWAKVLRRLDPSISLVAVGGGEWSVADWAWEVVPEVSPYVDYISFHVYWREEESADPWHKIQAGPAGSDDTIDELSAIIKMNRRRNPQARDLSIAVTEWNVSPMGGMMTHHPTYYPFEPTYYMRDALAVASFLNIMQRRCREVTLANVAQTINVVGLIMLNQEGFWLEPVYWPLWMQVRYSGPVVLDALVESETFDEPPSGLPQHYKQRLLRNVPYLDCSTTLDVAKGKLYISLVNRHKDEPQQVNFQLPGVQVKPKGVLHVLHHDDPMALNTPSEPEKVKPHDETVNGLGERFTLEVKPHAYVILELDLA